MRARPYVRSTLEEALRHARVHPTLIASIGAETSPADIVSNSPSSTVVVVFTSGPRENARSKCSS